jgi:site-specific DNA-adenine methylase
MAIDDHIELAEVLNSFKGKVLISGYPSRLYNKLYKTWTCEKRKMPNHASQQKVKPIKVELLWKNF